MDISFHKNTSCKLPLADMLSITKQSLRGWSTHWVRVKLHYPHSGKSVMTSVNQRKLERFGGRLFSNFSFSPHKQMWLKLILASYFLSAVNGRESTYIAFVSLFVFLFFWSFLVSSRQWLIPSVGLGLWWEGQGPQEFASIARSAYSPRPNL